MKVKIRCPVFKEGQEVVFNEYAARTRCAEQVSRICWYYSQFQTDSFFDCSSIRRGKIVRINSNCTYDIVHSANEERLDKFVLEEDLRAPEGAMNYGDLITLVKV
jgi:hypothetical protein